MQGKKYVQKPNITYASEPFLGTYESAKELVAWTIKNLDDAGHDYSTNGWYVKESFGETGEVRLYIQGTEVVKEERILIDEEDGYVWVSSEERLLKTYEMKTIEEVKGVGWNDMD